ncbi:MAG: hypothetical protein M1818_003169 [Claussenomyces sp. TS43310]|nr:MAG: hypothetical protein M1818_003169 [Claussenomyces sp. TS43310]
MLYFYLVIGKARPYLVADDTPTSTAGHHRDANLPIWPGVQMKMEFGSTASTGANRRQALSGNDRGNAHDRTGRRQQQQRHPHPASLMPGVHRTHVVHAERPQPTRTRSAMQLGGNPPAASAAQIGTPSSQPTASPSESRPVRLCFCGFDPNKEHEGAASFAQNDQTVAPQTAASTHLQRPQATRRSTQFSFVSSRPASALYKPLPPNPNRFRLGEDDLPWTTAMDVPSWLPEDGDTAREDIYAGPSIPSRSTNPPGHAHTSSAVSAASSSSPRKGHCHQPTISSISTGYHDGDDAYHSEDPQRTRDLGILQQAMMTVDSMDHDWWDADGYRDERRETADSADRRMDLGWAVRVEPSWDIGLRSPGGLDGMGPLHLPSEYEREGRSDEVIEYYAPGPMRRSSN